MIKVTLEFPTIEAAIATLGKIMGVKLPKESAAPELAQPVSRNTEAAAGKGSPGAADPKPRQRAERADKGVKRGSYKNVAGEKAPVEAQKADPPGVVPAPPATPETAAPATPTTPEATATESGSAIVTGAAAPTEAQVQKAIEAAHARTSTQAMMDLFARYGVRRGRELKPEQRVDFVKECETMGVAK